MHSYLVNNKYLLLIRKEINGWDRDRVKGFLQTVLGLGGNVIDVIYDQEVSGKAFLHLNEEQLTRDPSPYRLKYGPASAIAELVEQIKGANMRPPGRVHIFVDNSNVNIQGMINVGELENLYNAAGSEVETFDRGRQNHEKEVDSEMRMGNACVVTQASLQNEPGTIVLVSGIAMKATFKYLRNHYKYFTYGYGPDETNTMKFFDIANGNMFDNHEVLDLFTGINLFCWMSRKGNCLRLYFENDEDLSNVKNG
ncbi:hypothetical protein GLOIN_2v1484745 [Rhizophagus irregularis DAOM 181602=DAOM 197198]|uniref:Uncharacterized protein n=2 Tax=Rhizophagus irregularis TaxID=588596 RepID=A0A2P4PDA2_RHIID|nr:hypothetical protein GLOIN_2v1484745 [Rhizophagus irregularis DAOM 181602=DAOM 197198]POG63378.1 hypothetical protein GLOIN_2v1484745 [Rhizophagus irregularis DAOM 181602=DAOM 197198]|eukprot:XP_025170244.1 hypothetical protein GLOIN_2v1484745 [Rhizophagus irregularis DAOM 181602=DAOM 197198]